MQSEPSPPFRVVRPELAPTPGAEVGTAVVIPVLEADPIVRARTEPGSAGWIPEEQAAIAHITVLAPFVPPAAIDDGVLAELDRFFADVTPFGFVLSAVCEFPDGPLYLSPEPAAAFRRLTQQLHRVFPECPPYGGAFDEVVPHLSVPAAPGEDLATLTAALGPQLPLQAHAVEALLLHVEEENTHVIATFPFGTSAA